MERIRSKKGIKLGWKNKLKNNIPEEEEVVVDENTGLDSDEFEGNLLDFGTGNSDDVEDDFRWSLVQGVTSSPHKSKTKINNRFSVFPEQELYISDDVNEEAVVTEDDVEIENSEDASSRRKNSTSKTKKTKKKKSKSLSTEEPPSSSKSISSKKSGRSSKQSKNKKSSSFRSKPSSISKEALKKDKTKKKKKKKTSSLPSLDIGSCSEHSKLECGDPDSQESTASKKSSKSSRKVSFLNEEAETESFGDTVVTEDSSTHACKAESDYKLQADAAEADDTVDNPLVTTVECDVDNRNLCSPRSSDRHSIMRNKIRASLASLGERSSVSTLSASSARSSQVFNSPRTSDRTSILRNKIRKSLAVLTLESSSSARSSDAFNSHRPSQAPVDPAFLEAFDSDDRESVLERVSVQNKSMMDNLLDELRQYEVQLEEERSEISRERCMMQLKQEAVEQMLAKEMDRISQLESENFELSQRLDQSGVTNGEDALLQKIKMLEAENEVLRKKTERQDESIAHMAVKAKLTKYSHLIRASSGAAEMQQLPGKEQGELLTLRYSFAEQSKELAKMKEKMRSMEENKRVEELEQALENTQQQKDYFMEETQRLKQLLASQTHSKRSKKLKNKAKGWFSSVDKVDDTEYGNGPQESLLDMVDNKKHMVYGSASDIDLLLVSENEEEDSSNWLLDLS